MAKGDPARAKKTKAKRKKIEKLYEKKPMIEFVVAILSIPSILLLLILNFKSLTSINNAKPTPTPGSTTSTTGSTPNFFARPVNRGLQTTLPPNETQSPCTKGLGPVSITSPHEGDTIDTNPVEVDISYDNSKYCSAVWSYSVNGSNWSDYNNNSVALYNLPNGPIKFQLRVKSLTTSDSTSLTRDFVYVGQANAPIPTASSSAQ